MSDTGRPVAAGWRRRDLTRVGLLAALACASRSVVAQAAGRVWRIGYLGPPADVAPQLLDAFRDGLRTLGFVDGRTVAIDYRWTIRVRTVILAARKATANVPIVMVNGTDPVESGLAASLAHPDGNVTGMTQPACSSPATACSSSSARASPSWRTRSACRRWSRTPR